MIRTPQELFAHELRTMLWVERQLADEVLPELYDHVRSVDLKYGIERHVFETQDHARTLQSALHLLGRSPEAVESAAFVGLKAEHDELMATLDLERHDVVDLMHASVVVKAEHLEIAAYESLVAQANALGEAEIAAMLQDLLEQERHALEVAHRAAVKLLAETVEP